MGEEVAMAGACGACCGRIRRWILASYRLSCADGSLASSGLLARTEVCCLDCGHRIIVRIMPGTPDVAKWQGDSQGRSLDAGNLLRGDEPKPEVE